MRRATVTKLHSSYECNFFFVPNEVIRCLLLLQYICVNTTNIQPFGAGIIFFFNFSTSVYKT